MIDSLVIPVPGTLKREANTGGMMWKKVQERMKERVSDISPPPSSPCLQQPHSPLSQPEVFDLPQTQFSHIKFLSRNEVVVQFCPGLVACVRQGWAVK